MFAFQFSNPRNLLLSWTHCSPAVLPACAQARWYLPLLYLCSFKTFNWHVTSPPCNPAPCGQGNVGRERQEMMWTPRACPDEREHVVCSTTCHTPHMQVFPVLLLCNPGRSQGQKAMPKQNGAIAPGGPHYPRSGWGSNGTAPCPQSNTRAPNIQSTYHPDQQPTSG